MADVIILDEGKSQWLIWLANQNPENVLKFQMFTNDFTPDEDSVLGDFTLGTWTGTAVVTYNRANLSGPTIVAHVAIYNLTPPPQFTMTSGSPQNCYGWVLYDDDADLGLAALRFALLRIMRPDASETLDPFTIHLRMYNP